MASNPWGILLRGLDKIYPIFVPAASKGISDPLLLMRLRIRRQENLGEGCGLSKWFGCC